MSTDFTTVTAKAETMNANTVDEFVRVYFSCPMGHDLGSFPLDTLLDHPSRIYACSHWEHDKGTWVLPADTGTPS